MNYARTFQDVPKIADIVPSLRSHYSMLPPTLHCTGIIHYTLSPAQMSTFLPQYCSETIGNRNLYRVY